jgi:hypothetical protein
MITKASARIAESYWLMNYDISYDAKGRIDNIIGSDIANTSLQFVSRLQYDTADHLLEVLTDIVTDGKATSRNRTT